MIHQAKVTIFPLTGLPWYGSSTLAMFSRGSRCTLAPCASFPDPWWLSSHRLFSHLGHGALALQKNFLTPRQWSSMENGLSIPPTWHSKGYTTVSLTFTPSLSGDGCCKLL